MWRKGALHIGTHLEAKPTDGIRLRHIGGRASNEAITATNHWASPEVLINKTQ